MVLSVTGSSVFIGESLIPGGIEFLPTNMDAVDAGGKPTGKKLLIARTPLINVHRNLINTHLLTRGGKCGSMVMHEDGTAYVVERDAGTNSRRIPRIPIMDSGYGFHTVHSIKHGIRFIPDRALIMADPNLATHPAVNMTWYEGASQAAVLEDAHREATGQNVRVRMMKDAEYTCFVTGGRKYSEEQIKARAHLYHKGVKGTAPVADAKAASRTTKEGFVDVFGNVWIWTDGVNIRPETGADMDSVTRILRGVSWGDDPQGARVSRRFANLPDGHDGNSGVRWVAVPASGGAVFQTHQ